jgi:hypothetical protein
MDYTSPLIPIVNPLNLVPSKIEPLLNGLCLGTATAFHYLHRGRVFLITNWHNVAGRDPESLKPISKDCYFPEQIRISMARAKESPVKNAIQVGWIDQTLNLFVENRPIWLEHPVHRRKVDAVAIEISHGFELFYQRPANGDYLAGDRLTVSAGADVFVLGFPRGITGGGRLPIWKRGSLAHELAMDIDGLPKLLIDAATREGMSGSPVYAGGPGTWLSNPLDPIAHQLEQRRFLGIYSGRIGDDPFKASLGVVWKERAIIEIIEGGVRGKGTLGDVE